MLMCDYIWMCHGISYSSVATTPLQSLLRYHTLPTALQVVHPIGDKVVFPLTFPFTRFSEGETLPINALTGKGPSTLSIVSKDPNLLTLFSYS